MIDYEEGSVGELKRAEHLIYVSLKYTRTVDVIKSVIDRLISAFDCMIEDLLEHFSDEIKEKIPNVPAKKVEVLKKFFKDNHKALEAIDFYFKLRKLSRAKFKRTQEFRRHVTMITEIDGKEANVDIDTVTEYYHFTKKCEAYIAKLMKK